MENNIFSTENLFVLGFYGNVLLQRTNMIFFTEMLTYFKAIFVKFLIIGS